MFSSRAACAQCDWLRRPTRQAVKQSHVQLLCLAGYWGFLLNMRPMPARKLHGAKAVLRGTPKMKPDMFRRFPNLTPALPSAPLCKQAQKKPHTTPIRRGVSNLRHLSVPTTYADLRVHTCPYYMDMPTRTLPRPTPCTQHATWSTSCNRVTMCSLMYLLRWPCPHGIHCSQVHNRNAKNPALKRTTP